MPRSRIRYLLPVAAISAALTLAPVVSAAVPSDTSALRAAVDVSGVLEHLNALQAIGDANGGNRSSGTPGYDESVDYVEQQLQAAGYTTTRQSFEFPFFVELGSHFEQTSPNAEGYLVDEDYHPMEFSASGDVTAALAPVDVQIPPGATANSSTSGCAAADFAGFPVGAIALMQRGTCTFATKAANAEEAGASGAIIFNEGQPGRTALFAGTLGGPGIGIPVVSAGFDLGAELYGLTQAGAVEVHLMVDALSETRTTENLIAETAGGRDDRVVVVGAHLDAAWETVSMNDNGSGSAAILELAEQISVLGVEPVNKIRFIWFGAEEFGLQGSQYYVSQLSKRDLKNIAVNINVDMIASDNYVRFVYDGDGSAGGPAGPNGSGNVEQVLLAYFAGEGLATDPTALAGSSDYAPFMAAGVPVGGVFAGAAGVKTEAQAGVYGGTAGEPYYACYHEACDRVDELSTTVLEQLTDGAVHAAWTFAMTTSAVNGSARGNGLALGLMENLGAEAQR